MADQRHKYPRTHHLPWSPGGTDDDKILTTTAHFDGKQVIVTEKMDGENCTIGNTYTHARSTESRHHESRSVVKQLQGEIGHLLPENWRLCGENLYAKHSIGYDKLPAHFLLFSVWDDRNTCLSWSETVEWAQLLGLKLVPVLYKGPWDEDKITKLWDGKSRHGGTGEGYVVRLASSFPYSAFKNSVAKFVRPSHVQTDAHWMQQKVIPNKLAPKKGAWDKLVKDWEMQSVSEKGYWELIVELTRPKAAMTDLSKRIAHAWLTKTAKLSVHARLGTVRFGPNSTQEMWLYTTLPGRSNLISWDTLEDARVSVSSALEKLTRALKKHGGKVGYVGKPFLIGGNRLEVAMRVDQTGNDPIHVGVNNALWDAGIEKGK